MSNVLKRLGESASWRLMVDAAKRGAEQSGYKLTRVPGRGLSNIWNLERDGSTLKTSIRTTRDRWIAFPPLDGGTKWKTLDDVEAVLVAAVDSKADPRGVQIFLFSAEEVLERFNAAYAARTEAGHVIPDNYGFWVGLDEDDRGVASSVGSGLAKKYGPIATFDLGDLLAQRPQVAPTSSGEGDHPTAEGSIDLEDDTSPSLATVGEVMTWARDRIALVAGVRPESVKLDLKIEY